MQILNESASAYDHLSEALRKGGIICYPTETFYALGVDPWNDSACERLYSLKGRTYDKELPLIAASTQMVSQFCDTSDPRFTILAENFWPGPLTIVLPAADRSGTYAIRVSSNHAARRISESFGKPVISTSANVSGKEPIRKPEELDTTIISGINLLLDGGICPGGLPSTIVSLIKPVTEILREGVVPSQKILSLL